VAGRSAGADARVIGLVVARRRHEARHLLLPVLLREQPRHRAPDCLPCGHAEHPLGGGVEERHLLRIVEHHDRIHRRSDDLGEPRLRLLQLGTMAQLELAPLALAQQLVLQLDLLLLAIEIDEDADLRAQDIGLERLEHVVHRADRVALEDVRLLLADRGQEDDRDVARPLTGLDQARRVEAVHARHLDVEQDDRELTRQQVLERLFARIGADQRLRERLEDRFERQQVLRAIVDEQDVDFVGAHDASP